MAIDPDHHNAACAAYDRPRCAEQLRLFSEIDNTFNSYEPHVVECLHELTEVLVLPSCKNSMEVERNLIEEVQVSAENDGLAPECLDEICDRVMFMARDADLDQVQLSILIQQFRHQVAQRQLMVHSVFSRPVVSELRLLEQLDPVWLAAYRSLSRDGGLIRLPWQGDFAVPSYQLSLRPEREIGSIVVNEAITHLNTELGSARRPWEVAAWWCTPRDSLANLAPADVVTQFGTLALTAIGREIAVEVGETDAA